MIWVLNREPSYHEMCDISRTKLSDIMFTMSLGEVIVLFISTGDTV